MSPLPTLNEQPIHPAEAVDFAKIPKKAPVVAIGIALVIVAIVGSAAWMFINTTPVATSPQPVVGTVLLDSKKDTTSGLPPLSELQAPPMTQLSLQLANIDSAVATSTLERNKSASAVLLLQSKDADQIIDGVELTIRFDPESISNVSLKPSTVFKTIVRNSVSQETGTITFMAIRQPNETMATTAQTALATITFTPKKAGEMTLSFDAATTEIAGNGGENILEKTHDLTFSSN